MNVTDTHSWRLSDTLKSLDAHKSVDEMCASVPADWRQKLMKQYHQLFDDGAGRRPGFPRVRDGWSELVERAIRTIAHAVGHNKLTIDQICQKNGTLRVFYTHAEHLDEATQALIEDAVTLGEARSACTCEVCGEIGTLFEQGSWFSTACEKHARGRQVRSPMGWENVHIVRVSDQSGGRIIRCRRYVRETDAFEEITAGSLDIDD